MFRGSDSILGHSGLLNRVIVPVAGVRSLWLCVSISEDKNRPLSVTWLLPARTHLTPNETPHVSVLRVGGTRPTSVTQGSLHHPQDVAGLSGC